MKNFDHSINLRRMIVRDFVQTKRRLPATSEEFAEWLIEFDSCLLKLIDKMQEIAVDSARRNRYTTFVMGSGDIKL